MDVVIAKKICKHFTLHHEKKRTIYDYLFSRKKYSEDLIALNNISFSLKKGECLGIIGRNGSGKSTLLKIIAGIIKPSSGLITVKGKVVPIIELGIGFQPDFTGRENIYLYGSILGIPKDEIDKKINDIVSFAELEKFIDTPIKKYSLGMNSKLAFTTAVLSNPDILLIDEILSVGDLSFQRKSMMKIKEYKNQGTSIIFVSHSMKDISEICDRCILLDKGNIIREGKVDNIVNYYSQKILLEDQKKLSQDIIAKKNQIRYLKEEKKKIKDSKQILDINEHILALEKEYVPLFKELRSIRYSIIENIKNQIQELSLQKNKIEEFLSSDKQDISTRISNVNLTRINNKIRLLTREKNKELYNLNTLIFSELEYEEDEKLNLLQELRNIIGSLGEKDKRWSIEFLINLICQELKKGLSDDVKNKYADNLCFYMREHITTTKNIDIKIKLIKKYEKIILHDI